MKFVQEPAFHWELEVILNSEYTGAKGQLPVLKEGCRGPAIELEGPKELWKMFLKPKGLGFGLRQPLSCLAKKGEPQKSGLWLSEKHC